MKHYLPESQDDHESILDRCVETHVVVVVVLASLRRVRKVERNWRRKWIEVGRQLQVKRKLD